MLIVLCMCVERRKQERREETETRRRTWQERFAERSDSRSAAAADTEEAGRKRTGTVCAAISLLMLLLHTCENCDIFSALTHPVYKLYFCLETIAQEVDPRK